MQQKGVDRGKPDLHFQLNTMVRERQFRLAPFCLALKTVSGEGRKLVGTVRFRMQTGHENTQGGCVKGPPDSY